MTIDEKPTEAVTLSIELLESNPKLRSGRPVIKGRTIMVQDIAAYHIFQQQSPDEIADALELTLPQVHAALAYYYLHKEEIDASIRRAGEYADVLKEQGIGSTIKPVSG